MKLVHFCSIITLNLPVFATEVKLEEKDIMSKKLFLIDFRTSNTIKVAVVCTYTQNASRARDLLIPKCRFPCPKISPFAPAIKT
jgi:hypothetical protein